MNNRTLVKALSICLVLISCASAHKKTKTETVYRILGLLKEKKYEQALEYIPYGFPTKTHEESIILMTNISSVLSTYGLPEKNRLLFEYSKGGDAKSSYTKVIVPVYLSKSENDSIKKVEIVMLFMDNLGDKKIGLLDLEMMRKMQMIEP